MPAWHPRQGGKAAVIAILGFTQCLAWGSSYYLLAVLAKPIAADTGWALTLVVSGLSLGLLVAGFVSPRVGSTIERLGGRKVLSFGSAALALGLACLGIAHGPLAYFAAWAILGIGMAAGLYDAAFSSLVGIYGVRAKGLITNLTLIGGFASTLAWPFSTLLLESFGWRDTCLVYAGLHALLGLPMHLLLLPARSALPAAAKGSEVTAEVEAEAGSVGVLDRRVYLLLVVLLGTMFTLQSSISSVLSVHLLTMLQGLGLGLAAAVGYGAMVGPSQVGGRLLQIALGRYFHPVWTAVATSAAVLIGVALLLFGNAAIIVAAVVCYGAGNGVATIVRGTLPLHLFGPVGYATLLGRFAMSNLIAQAFAPAAIALVLGGPSPRPALLILVSLALVNLVLSCALRLSSPRGKSVTGG
ncbi:MAG TPA: MFS transporter [Alphaproteobacteria bacterium]|nr:MFS transporter [Alphaproteobacteria bacterium]